MDVASLQKVIFAVAESQSLDAVLQMIVRGLAERPEVALARIWLTAPGDICATCHMRSICPDQSSCLHLMASAGNPFIEAGSAEANADAWSRTNGHFCRMPLNAPLKIGYAGGTGQSVLIHIQEGHEKQPWIARPDWVWEQRLCGNFRHQGSASISARAYNSARLLGSSSPGQCQARGANFLNSS